MSCEIHVDKHSPLVDEVIHIRVTGLRAHQHVTMLARLQEGQKRLYSLAYYEADSQGDLDLHTTSSLGGCYTGTEPMGLFWSMEQEPGQRPGVRIMKRDVTTPLVTSLAAYDAHCGDVSELIEGQPLATTTVNRWYLASDVTRVEVNEGDLQATFFIPKDGDPYPGVVDLFGYLGGKTEHRAALLASKGFATLALQHVGTGRNASMTSDLAYFRIKAVVAINGFHFLAKCDMFYRDRQFPSVPMPEDIYILRDGCVCIKDTSAILSAEDKRRSTIPVEETSAWMLLCTGEEDMCIEAESSQCIIKRKAEHGQAHMCEMISYPGAGHLMEPPYSSHCYSSYNAIDGRVWLWGGKPKQHAEAQDDFWGRMQAFLKDKLSVTTDYKM